MNYLIYEFFDEFKALDNLCKDIYGKSMDNKLGVTLYLEDMEKNHYQGCRDIPSWSADYYRLKKARNLRNELAHSNNSFSYEMCSEEDILFIHSFHDRILNQTDPIALLKKTKYSAASSPSHQQYTSHLSTAGSPLSSAYL